MASSHGLVMPPVGAHSAAMASDEMNGSSSTILSRPMISSPGTPLALPRSSSSFKWGTWSGAVATTRVPVFLYITPSSCVILGYMAFPATLNRALLVPGSAS
ncbi:MAG: hypothetical protein BWY85_02073 [Firmicutes bacterium ADurb.Bin506]|nr:MAG: hypothetical protein BWY85_02073 [Firmicutes bacterium ADurb.Bin506]